MAFLRFVVGSLFLIVGVACVASAAHDSIGWTLVGLALAFVIWEVTHRRRSRAP